MDYVTLYVKVTHNDQKQVGGVNVVPFIYIHNKKCEECNAKTLAYDPQHDIIYCLACGLVHKDNNIITDYDKLMEKEAKEKKEKEILNRKLRLQKHDERIILNSEGNAIFSKILVYVLVMCWMV